MAPDRVYLHIGLHKTGTTYLQNVLRANREHCRAQGVEFPGGDGQPQQMRALSDLTGRRPRGSDDRRIEGQWDALLAALHASELPAALLSDERLSISSVRQARGLIQAFPESDVHVIVTARDLARVTPSAWQEEIKNGATWTWQQFVDSLTDPTQVNRSPARGYWQRQDLPRICAIWAAQLPPGRLHVVTVPPSGSSPNALLERFCSVVGLDAARLVEQPHWNNETIGVAATEVVRRLNVQLGGRLNQRQYDQIVKRRLVPELARQPDARRFSMPPEQLNWLSARAESDIDAIRAAGYDVVGDVTELRPVQDSRAVRPDSASQAELVESAITAAAIVTEASARAWWQRRRADEPTVGKGSLRSRVRGVMFRTQRRAAGLADRNHAAAAALGVVIKARSRASGRSREQH